MTSMILRSKNFAEFAGRIRSAVSAPLLVPAIAIISRSTGMSPASAAIRVISTQTFVPSHSRLSTFAMSSKGWIVPNSFRIAFSTPLNAWVPAKILLPFEQIFF